MKNGVMHEEWLRWSLNGAEQRPLVCSGNHPEELLRGVLFTRGLISSPAAELTVRQQIIQDGKSIPNLKICIFQMDYCNPANPKPFALRMKQMRAAADDMPYRLAFEKLSYRYLTFAKKISLFLIRHRWTMLLALFFKTYRKISSHSG